MFNSILLLLFVKFIRHFRVKTVSTPEDIKNTVCLPQFWRLSVFCQHNTALRLTRPLKKWPSTANPWQKPSIWCVFLQGKPSALGSGTWVDSCGSGDTEECVSAHAGEIHCQYGDTIELMTSHPALAHLMRASRNTVPLHSSFTSFSSIFEAANWGFSLCLLACYHEVSLFKTARSCFNIDGIHRKRKTDCDLDEICAFF